VELNYFMIQNGFSKILHKMQNQLVIKLASSFLKLPVGDNHAF